MTTQHRALALSLLLHCGLAAIVLAAQQNLLTTTPPLVIDLSLSVSEAMAGEADTPLGSPVAAPLSTPTTPLKPQAIHSPTKPAQQPLPQTVHIAPKPPRKAPAKASAKKRKFKPAPLAQTTAAPAPVQQNASPAATTIPSSAPPTTGSAQAAPSSSPGPLASAQAGFRGGNHGKGSPSRYDFNAVRKKILNNLRFPSTARKLGLSGKIVVSFVLKTDGHVEAINVVTSSGHAILDRAVVATIRRIAPFSKPPVRAQLMLPIVFHLRS
ncbi:energy transducer TonB [Desulfobulbus rhabdoformis]|uniref:energy transducer TonB n=1 Tax=Desulfobulbus rhabdoformis TaxID=34032 RepID=UPI001965EF16|nr:energy transducer TonB [Desulfobulbus rhabdoformis]MBM9615522.1 energy transducer TonB [Desulfobulbus rhabdoformis]